MKQLCSNLHNKNLYNGKVSKRKLLELLETTSKSSFIFDYFLYKHVEGVAVDSPLGPTLANSFLCNYEKKWLANCFIQIKPMI